jgi:hypothetical protein
MVVDNAIYFPEHVFYEDAFFNFLTGLYANKVVKVDKCFYHYYQSKNSTVRVRNNPKAYDRIKTTRMLAESCKERGLYSAFENLINDKFVGMTASNVLYTCLDGFDNPSEQHLQEVRDDVKRLCPSYRRTLAYKNMSLDLRWYLNTVMKNPQRAIWCYKHNASKWLGYAEVLLHLKFDASQYAG